MFAAAHAYGRPPGGAAPLVTVRTYAERESFRERRQNLEAAHAAHLSAIQAATAVRERGLRLERARQEADEAEREVARLSRRGATSTTVITTEPQTAYAPSPPPPECPSPDYDTTPAPSPAPAVDMQSLDPLTLLEPRARAPAPKPPQTYFVGSMLNGGGAPNGVRVTIGEYCASRQQPARLSFLDETDGSGNAGGENRNGLQSELARTLNRSNLRALTERTAESGSTTVPTRKSDPSFVPNGILKKTGTVNFSDELAVKTISFGTKTTIINESPKQTT